MTFKEFKILITSLLITIIFTVICNDLAQSNVYDSDTINQPEKVEYLLSKLRTPPKTGLPSRREVGGTRFA